MTTILYALLVLGIMGAVFGLILAIASRVFAVKTDDRLEPITQALPGANCGGCGFTGCAAYAQAIIDGTMLLGASQASLASAERLPFVLGFVSASFLWFNGVTAAISLFRGKITDKILQVINIVCGCIIVFYGIKLLLSFFQML